MRRAAALLLAVVAFPAAAAPPSKKPPSLSDRVDAVMAPLARRDAPGCAVAVVQRGKIVHERGYGMADLERKVPIGPDTRFDIGSTSKQFTAASILLLAAEGKLSLDDDVRKHLPEVPSYGKTITLRHLLHHTGGLRDYTALLFLAGHQLEDVTTAGDALRSIARQKAPEFAAGSRFGYSNTGYFLLGQVVERAAGKTLALYAAEKIFTPLGMASTHFHDDHTRLVPDRAVGYAPAMFGYVLAMSNWEQTGDGAVMTTVRDLARWDANFYDAKVGGQALVDAMLTRGKTDAGEELGYASGLMLEDYRGLPSVSHGGAWAGYRSELLRFPSEKTSVVVLCNSAAANPSKHAREIADVVLEKAFAAAEGGGDGKGGDGKGAGGTSAADATPAKLTSAELDAWVGSYRDGDSGATARIVRDGDALIGEFGPQRLPITPTAKAEAVILAPRRRTLTLSGKAPRRRVVVVSSQTYSFDEYVPVKPKPAELAPLAGRYRSAELDVAWTITVDGDKVSVVDPRGDSLPMTAAAADQFDVPRAGLFLRFTRKGKRVTGFSILAPRLGTIAFAREK